MSPAFGLSSAGAAIAALLLLLVLPRALGRENAGAWLSLALLETLIFYLGGLAQALGPGSSAARFLALLDGLYGLPALYLFTRSILDDPPPAPFRHFLPILGAGITALVLLAWRLAGGGPDTDRLFSRADALFWFGESVQLLVYGFMIQRRLREPRRLTPRILQARFIAFWILASYALLFIWIWLTAGLAFVLALSSGREPAAEYTGAAELAIGFPFVLSAGYALLSRPWLLHGEAQGQGGLAWVGARDLSGGMEPEASPPESPQGAADRSADMGAAAPLPAKYRRSKLPPAEAARILGRARAWLAAREDLSPEAVTPRSLADALGLSYHALSRAANEAGAGGVPGLITAARLDRAAILLSGRPELGILDVAFEAGFPAKSSFNEAWQRRHGVTPSAWRRARSG